MNADQTSMSRPPGTRGVEAARWLGVAGRWRVHGYYTLSPYAPDGSGRLLLAEADLASGLGEVIVAADNGVALNRLGEQPVTASFWHTGFWQSWSPGSQCVYFQSGTLTSPRVVRHELDTGQRVEMEGDLEGLPPSGEPGLSCSHSLLYAAGYGDGRYKPDKAAVPFQDRHRHGISRLRFDTPPAELVLSTQAILDQHPDRDRLATTDRDIKARLGGADGLTLMTYCVRWNPQGSRCLFYFGNHCVDPSRGEPRLAYVFTADRELCEVRLAVDLGFDRSGVHWGWHPDGEHLIGYGPADLSDPDQGMCIAQVHHSGADYRKIATHRSGGHPSICPTDPDLLVTDTYGQGLVAFIDLREDRIVAQRSFTRRLPDAPPGRGPGVIDLHPVFSPDGSRVLINTLADGLGTPVELVTPRLH